MKKIVILTYYYPPCNITGAQRPFSWAKYFHKFGFYPIVITRNWDKEIHKPEDAYAATGESLVHEKFDDHEVYYLPYKPSLRDRLLVKYGDKKRKKIRQLLTLVEVISQNFTNLFIPYKNLYRFTLRYLKKNTDIKLLVTTANPYTMFRFAWKLKKKTDINWIADYRDDWNTRGDDYWFAGHKIFTKIRPFLEIRSEKKWLSNCSGFSTISPFYVSKIAPFIDKPGVSVYNGFVEEDFSVPKVSKEKDQFVISYNGTLQPFQRIEIFLNGLKNFITNYNPEHDIIVQFIGTGFDDKQTERLLSIMEGFENNIKITERMQRHKAIEMQLSSDVLLLVAYHKGVGAPGTKTFDYLGAQKPILLCPSDNDIMEKILSESGQGIVCNDSETAEKELETLYSECLNKGRIELKIDHEKRLSYTRENQTEVLASFINEIC